MNIPKDIEQNHSFREYKHLAINGSILSDEYCHFVRKPDERDDKENHAYYGEWEDVTEKDKQEERIKRKQEEIEEIKRQMLKEARKTKNPEEQDEQ